MAKENAQAHAPVGERSFTAEINFLASSCSAPSVHNGDFSRNVFPLESARVTIWDGETLATPPSLDVEGFCRVPHTADLTDVADSPEATVAFRASLVPVIRELTGADEVEMLPFSMIRRQAATVIDKDVEAGVPADFVHSDNTDSGALQVEKYFYSPAGRSGVRRMAQYNLWKLLSPSPTNFPLALCDARSVRPGDIVPGPAYFPTIDAEIDTGFFHPNDHFRWVYYSRLNSDQVLIFKQFDSDSSRPVRVPHTAFKDPTCPPGAHPRVSIENRCIARWYD